MTYSVFKMLQSGETRIIHIHTNARISTFHQLADGHSDAVYGDRRQLAVIVLDGREIFGRVVHA